MGVRSPEIVQHRGRGLRRLADVGRAGLVGRVGGSSRDGREAVQMAVRDHTAGRQARPIFPEGLARRLGVTQVGGALREHVVRRQDQGARFSPGPAQPSPAPQRADGRDRQRQHDAQRQQEQDHLPHRRAPAPSGRAGRGQRRQREPARELPTGQVLELPRKFALTAGRPRHLCGSATGCGGTSRRPGGTGGGGVLVLVRDGVRPTGRGLEGEPAVRREQHLDPDCGARSS